MTAGIEVFNDFGTLQITDRDPTLALRYKRVVNTDSSGYATTTFTDIDTPIVAFACPTVVNRVTQRRVGTTMTVTFWAGASSAATLYLFDRPISAGGSGIGLQVFDAAGKCTFDSTGQYCRVVAANPPDGNWIGRSGRTYAGAILAQRWMHEFEPTPDPDPLPDILWDHYYYSSAVQSITNGLFVSSRYAYQIVREQGPPPRPRNYIRGNENPFILIIDVTGY